MDIKKFFLVLVPVFAFILVACGGLFNNDAEVTENGETDNDFVVDLDLPIPTTMYDGEEYENEEGEESPESDLTVEPEEIEPVVID